MEPKKNFTTSSFSMQSQMKSLASIYCNKIMYFFDGNENKNLSRPSSQIRCNKVCILRRAIKIWACFYQTFFLSLSLWICSFWIKCKMSPNFIKCISTLKLYLLTLYFQISYEHISTCKVIQTFYFTRLGTWEKIN